MKSACNLVLSLLVHVAQFDVAIRKLLPELQARSRRLCKSSVFSFWSPVHFDNIAFACVVSGEVVPHQNPQHSPQERANKAAAPFASPLFRHLSKFCVNDDAFRRLGLAISVDVGL